MSTSTSDAPVRPSGLRTRSGNAMHRTRSAILDAAADCVERVGVRRTTMGELARAGGVAKATLYNHFRTKDDVLAALVEARAQALALECRALAGGPAGLAGALEHAAARLGDSRPLRRVAQEEPALLAPLAAPGEGRAWDGVREGLRAVLVAGGAAGTDEQVELVLRWLLSALLWPPSPAAAATGAERLARALLDVGPVEPVTEPVTEPAPGDGAGGASGPPSPGRAEGLAVTGLGWPAVT